MRDLRERTGDLIRDAEAGHLALVTKHGQPVFLAVPFEEELIKSGLRILLAIHLFKDGVVNLSKAAKLAGESQESFIERIGALEIPVVKYSVQDLETELQSLDEEND